MPEDNAALSPELLALKELEKQNQSVAPSPDILPASPTTQTPLQKVKTVWKNFPRAIKLLLIPASAVIIFLLLYTMIMITSLDTKFFPLGLSGTVINDTGTRVVGAVVKINGLEFTTNDNGEFFAEGLELARYQVEITADGYESLSQEVAMSRSFMNYVNQRIFALQTAGEASLSGKLNSPDPQHRFFDDYFEAGDKTYKISTDGSFEISDLSTGPNTITYRSVYFKDIPFTLDLKPGKNSAGETDLIPAGDITGSVVSWLREDLVLDLSVTVEGIPNNQIDISPDGKLRIRDLEADRTYKIRTQRQGYQTREYEKTVVQGENELFDLRLVESGRVIFQRPSASGQGNDLVATDYDGKNPQILVASEKSSNIYAETPIGNLVYYLTNRDNIRAFIGGDALLAYVVQINGGNPQRLTTNFDLMGSITPGFYGSRLANVRGTEESDEDRLLETMSFDGNSRTEIFFVPSDNRGVFNDITFSEDGNFLFFYLQTETGAENGLYRAAATLNPNPQLLLNKPNLQIYSVSNDGDQVIYSATNTTSGLLDLFLYKVSTGQDKRLKTTFTGSQYQFVSTNNDLVVFHDYREGGNNLYQLKLSTDTETRLTRFSDVEGVDAIYQQSGLIVYQTNKGLYLLDISKPHSGKQVTTDFARYTGYDF